MAKRRKSIDNLSPTDINADGHPEDEGVLSPGPGKESFKIAQYWKSQDNSYEAATRKWVKRGNTVVKRFRDERNKADEEGTRRMNLLWANYKVMKPAIYSRCPDPVVDRKFLDRDPVGRLSAQILERTLRNELKPSGYHDAISRAVDDRLLPGKGVVWCRYVPEIGKGVSIPAPTQNGAEDPLVKIGEEFHDKDLTDETDEETQLDESGSEVLSEKVEVDYVDWHDFAYYPVKARTWREVQAIRKRVHISKKEAIERFGEKIGKALKPDTDSDTSGNNRQGTSDTAVFQDINERNITIFEIWNKSDKKAYWVSPGYDYLCDVEDDPLELVGFFPIPPPLMSTKTNDTLVPVPDYYEWQDQAIQIDELTQRIAMLSKACKVAGVYNAANTAVSRILEESVENQLIPVDQWAIFDEAGGLKGVVDFLPLDTIQSAIETLQGVRQQCMIDLDQITGLSDIVRGTSDSRETLGGIRLKNNNAGTRLSESQEDIAQFARDTLEIVAEIACKHFSDETLIESSGILYEDALQPDTVMRELMEPEVGAGGMPKPKQLTGPQQGPTQGLLPSPTQMPPQAPTGGSVPGAPSVAPAQAGGGQAPTQQAPGANVIPFPGAAGQVPAQPPPDPQTLIMMKVMRAIELLRGDIKRGYRIDIETDSTIFGDKEQDKANVNEFLTALGGYMKQLEGAAQFPESLPLFAKALQWGIRRYRTGRDLEAEVDAFCEAVRKKAKEMIANPQPSPEQQKADAEIKQSQMEADIQNQNDQRDAQRQAENDQREMAMQQEKNQMEVNKSKLDFQIAQEDSANKREIMNMEMTMMREKHNLELAKIRAEMIQTQQEHQIKEKEVKIDKEKATHEMNMHKEETKLEKQDLGLDKQKLTHKKKEHTHKVKVQAQQQKKKAS